ncbi:MAG: glycosyltransferase [Bacteroidia bacterium]|nr:glycosyltransferase [Bacteroidia bacterium]MCZ2278150.1 glycosyltransferase [Bacteroidia bacterium]
MKISVITITYNSRYTIEDTIHSVLSQDYKDVEYIIVDGLSKDGTMDIVNKYKERIHRIVSEKDKGLYDALNKGISLATGDVVGMLHSDDVYAAENILSLVAGAFNSDPAIEGIYGDLVFVNRNDVNKIMRRWTAGEYREDAFTQGWMPPHPTFYVKRECYEKFGGFNTSLKLSADYELMLRMIHKNKIKIHYIPETLIRMRMGGTSNVSIFVKIKANLEDQLAWKLNGMKPGVLTIIKKPLKKLRQYLKWS